MKKVIIAVAAMVMSSAAMAGPSWTYVDLGYVTSDSGDESTDGLALRGSFGFGGLWHIQGALATIESFGGKGKPGGSDDTLYSIRGGIHPAVTDTTDFVLDIGYTSTEEDNGVNKPEPSFFDIRTGSRMNIGALELRAFVSLAFGDDDGSPAEDFRNVGYEVGAQYNFSDAWSAGVDAAVDGGRTDVANIYVRWSF